MIVLSMTTEEIYREIMRDFEIIKRRSYHEGKILQKEMLRKKLQSETRTVCYKTPHCNEWNIIFQMDSIGFLNTRKAKMFITFAFLSLKSNLLSLKCDLLRLKRCFFSNFFALK